MSHLKVTVLRLVLIAMALILVLGAIPAQAAKSNQAPAINPGPLNHREELRATVNAKAKLTRVELRIDTKKVQPWVKAHAGWKYSIRYPLQKLKVGMHTANLKVRDQKNRSSQRQWKFQKLAQLALSADKSSIQAGEKITLTGQGFTPGTAITVDMGSQNTGVSGNYGSAVAGSKGAFTVEVTLDRYPDNSPLHAGTITLVAHNSDGSEKANVDLRVLPAPKLTLDKSSIKPGEQVRVTGEGFTPGVAVSISLGAPNTGAGGNYGSAVTDSTGAFALNVTLERYPDGSPLKPGTVVLLAHTADSAEKATAQLQVKANPSLTASKTVIRVGEWIVLNGEGFTPGKVVTISLAGIDMGHGDRYGTAAVDANGRFSAQLFLGRYPDGTPLPPGGITLMASTADGEQAMVGLQLVDDPAISLNKAGIKPGEQVLVTGKGFTSGASIIVSIGPVNGGTGGNYGNVRADTNGGFSLPVTLARYPDGSPLKPGTIVLLAHTADFSQKASAQLQVLATPELSLDRAGIQPGDQVMVTGQGFTPSTPVTISLGGVNTGASGNYGTAVADASGRFRVAVTLERYPNGLPLQAGPVVLVAHNASWDEKASAQLQVVTLTATPMSVQPSDPITLKGEGFTPGSGIILSMAVNGAAPAGNFGTAGVDAAGRFVLTAKLTQYPGGSPLQPGPLVLVVHDPSWSQRAAVQIQILDRAPSAPSDLRISSLTRGSTSAEPTVAGLQWKDNAPNETGFRIQATFTRMNGGTDTQMWNVPANSATAQVSFMSGGINPVTRACFTVTAFNGQGDSPPSNEVCALL